MKGFVPSRQKMVRLCLAQMTLPMAQTSQVESRLRAVLYKERNRTMLTQKTTLLAAAVTAAALLPLAALRPVARAQAAPTSAPSAPLPAPPANNPNTHQSFSRYIRHQPDSSVFKYQQLGEQYQLQAFHGAKSVRRDWAQKALTQFQKAQSLDKNSNFVQQDSILTSLAKMAYSAGHYHQAQAYATQLLQHGQNKIQTGEGEPKPNFELDDGNQDVHEANMVLGRLALRNEDTAQAEADLRAMGNVSGSAQLDSFGPNMLLARDLLKRGDRQPVLVYFQECAKFWKDDNGQLKTWTAQVQQGKIPDFRGNLAY